jgi:hypothetical protein
LRRALSVLTLRTEVEVQGVTARAIYDFLINCTTEEYQKWWKGTHLKYETLKRYPDNVGNVVFMDEYVGKHRLTMKAVILRAIPGSEIVLQMKKGVRLPVWLSLSFEEGQNGVKVIHEITAGFTGVGRVLDGVFRVFLSKDFERAMDEHAKMEFPKLRAILKR